MIKNKYNKNMASFILASIAVAASFSGCTDNSSKHSSVTSDQTSTYESKADTTTSSSDAQSTDKTDTSSEESTDSESSAKNNTSEIFSKRDLEQTPDLNDSQSISIENGKNVSITKEGVYKLSGTADDVTITVEAPDDAKVQLVLDGLHITNTDAPAVYIRSCDKAFITTTESDNTLSTTDEFAADSDTNLDAVIFSKSDLTLNGTGSLNLSCGKGNGISAKDDLYITGGSYTINSAEDCIEANDSISVCDGSFYLTSQKDAIKCNNKDDLTKGSVYISGGTFDICAADDGIQGTTTVVIDGGTITISSCSEGIEATNITINDGTIDINASDDGINAAQKSTAYDIAIEFNGGSTTISMGAGDTDAVDSNGTIYVNDGIINITAPTSSFDYDVAGEIRGGTVTVNGEQITEMPEDMMGGRGQHGGGMQGGMKRDPQNFNKQTRQE
ncbi:MAG: carbohydrate-binding domain-containing protein [Oscillospiraceae bacterium]|nr:carbohydrate-binding domain-containing protein [Oscillospiraceae bacterium]